MQNKKTKYFPYGVLSIYILVILCTCLPLLSIAQDTTKKGRLNPDLHPSNRLLSDQYVSYDLKLLPNYYQLFSDSEIPSKKINLVGIALTSAALTGVYSGLFSYEQDRRWKGPESDFHFTHSLSARGADKAGHFFATKVQASFISNLYSLSNVNSQTADLLGVGIALSAQTLVEVKDGLIDDRGFDVYDEIANILGASWYYGRERSPFLQRFQIRWLYYPSSNRDSLAPGHRFTEDYTGHSYWLGAKVSDLVPYWPKFIVPVGGINLNNWIPDSPYEGEYSFHISLNPDFDYIFPRKTALGRTFADLFNSFYIPAPAVEVYPNFGFKLVFYGQK